MTKRVRIAWLCGGLAALVLAAFAAPYGYWGVVGLRNGEPFYRGLPYSYWRVSLRRRDEWIRNPPVWERYCPDRVLKLLDVGRLLPVESGDPAALPVVLRLLGDADAGGVSGDAIHNTPLTPATVAVLRQALDDPSEHVCYEAAVRLQELTTETDAVVAAYLRLSRRANLRYAPYALYRLGDMDGRAKAAVPELLRLQAELPEWELRESAKGALQRIDPVAAERAGIPPPPRPPAERIPGTG